MVFELTDGGLTTGTDEVVDVGLTCKAVGKTVIRVEDVRSPPASKIRLVLLPHCRDGERRPVTFRCWSSCCAH